MENSQAVQVENQLSDREDLLRLFSCIGINFRPNKRPSNKALIKSLLRDPVFYFFIGMLLCCVYYKYYVDYPRYTVLNTTGYNFSIEVLYNKTLIGYTGNRQTLYCFISIPSKNFTWSSLWPKPIPSNIMALIKKTNPQPKICA